MDNNTALAFNTICNFIRDLSASFGTKQKSLLLYGHLIEKTGLINIEPVKKHINYFKKFVEDNADAIENQNKSIFRTYRIVYSDKVSIDLQDIFQICDKDEEKIIWNHLLTISAVLNPAGNAKKILKDLNTNFKSGKNEDNFLKNIMEKIGKEVESHQDENVNPMQMIGSMMSSGVLNDVFQSLSQGMNEGNLNLGEMMNSMQGLMSNISTMVDQNDSLRTPATTTAPVIEQPTEPTLDS